MLALVVDTETTAIQDDLGTKLEPKAVEVGWALYCCDNKDIMSAGSFLTDEPPDQITKRIAGISEELWQNRPDFLSNLKPLQDAVLWSQVIIAHNAPFDREVLKRSEEFAFFETRPWADSLLFSHEKIGFKLKSLNETAASLGVPTGTGHRALSDVQTLCGILKNIPDLESQIQTQIAGKRFTIGFTWQFSHPHFDVLKHVARKAGFHWDVPAKAWIQSIYAQDVDEAFDKLRQRLAPIKAVDGEILDTLFGLGYL